jgi:hypothetical protein
MARLVLISRLARDRSGAAAAEAALVIPMFLLLAFAAVDFALGFSARMNLVATAARTAELATGVGQVRADYAFLEAEAEAATTQPGANATVDTWLECNGIRNGPINGICPAGQSFARYVSVTIQATYSPLIGIGGFLGSGVPIGGSATVRIQ